MKCAVTASLLGLAGLCLAADVTNVKVVEQIVAKVNNEIVTRGDLDKAHQQAEAEGVRQQLPAARLREFLKQTDDNVLRDKIDQLLLVQRARDLSINVDPEVSKRLAQLQVEAKITDPDKFQQYVREQAGIPFEDFKQQMRDSMLTSEVVRREVGSKISIPKADQLKYYEEHKNEFVREEQVFLREIFLSTDGKDAAAVDKKVKDLVARARKGENFGNLARDNSEAETAKNYGELPPFKRGLLDKSIENTVFAQAKGYVSDPIKRPNGWLILKVDDHYTQGLQPFEAVENEVAEKLYMPKMQPAVRAYLTKLRQDAFLEIRAGFIDSGAAAGKDTSWRDPAKLKPQTVTKQEAMTRVRHKRLLWTLPIPGTNSNAPRGPVAAPAAAPAPASAPAPTVPPGTPGATSTQTSAPPNQK